MDRDSAPQSRLRVVVAGVAGSGKSTVAAGLSERLGAPWLDGDDLHRPDSVLQMAAGVALTDSQRIPWLELIRDRLRSEDRIIIACSALSKHARDVLRQAGDVLIVFLDISEEQATARASARSGHFMGAGMVASQFQALQEPVPSEVDVVLVDAAQAVEDVIHEATEVVRGRYG